MSAWIEAGQLAKTAKHDGLEGLCADISLLKVRIG